jgi:hypothetical protein
MDHGPVPDSNLSFQNAGKTGVGVKHGTILNIALPAHHHQLGVSSQNRAEPD